MEFVPGSIIPPLPTTERGHGLHIDGTLKKEKRLLYCSGNLVIQRDLDDVNKCRINSEHAVRVMTAKFHPINGEWIVSGDEGGQVFVWTYQSYVVKNTITVGKTCLDLAWSADGQRIVAVGQGKDEKGKVFPWNTNNKLGTLGGAQKGLLSCDFKPTRPFRVIAGSEDFGVYLYKGPPFKFEAASKDHTNYVNCVRYSPDGSKYVSVSSDRQILVFDGKTGEKLKEICDGKSAKSKQHHAGTIYSVSWNPAGTHFVTSSADKTCKVWEYETGALAHTFTLNDKPTLNDMQVTCLWMEGYIMSISLSGRINYFDPAFKEERPIRVLTGHKKAINDVDYDPKSNCVFTVCNDARLVKTECKSGECVDVVGDTHKCPALAYVRTSCDGQSVYTLGVNDTLCKSSVDDEKSGAVMGDKVMKFNGAARGCVVGNKDAKLVVIPTHKNRIVFVTDFDSEAFSELEVKYTPTCCAIDAEDSLLAVGSGREGDNAVYFYDVGAKKECGFVLSNTQYIRAEIIVVAISPDGKLLATGMKDKNIWIWDLEAIRKGEKVEQPLNFNRGMKFHAGQISSVEFSPDGKWLLTAGYDSNVYLFTAVTEGKSDNIHYDHAANGLIKKAMFLSQNKIVIVGDDASIRFFEITDKK